MKEKFEIDLELKKSRIRSIPKESAPSKVNASVLTTPRILHVIPLIPGYFHPAKNIENFLWKCFFLHFCGKKETGHRNTSTRTDVIKMNMVFPYIPIS